MAKSKPTTVPSEANSNASRLYLEAVERKRLIKNWLPPSGLDAFPEDEILENDNKDENNGGDDDFDEDGRAGLGLPLASTNSNHSSQRDLSSASFLSYMNTNNEALRHKLLGKKTSKPISRYNQSSEDRALKASKPRPQHPVHTVDHDSEDDEEQKGRSSKRSRPHATTPSGAPFQDDQPNLSPPKAPEQQDTTIPVPKLAQQDIKPSKKRPTSYLDEILAERAAKKKKKNKAQ